MESLNYLSRAQSVTVRVCVRVRYSVSAPTLRGSSTRPKIGLSVCPEIRSIGALSLLLIVHYRRTRDTFRVRMISVSLSLSFELVVVGGVVALPLLIGARTRDELRSCLQSIGGDDNRKGNGNRNRNGNNHADAAVEWLQNGAGSTPIAIDISRLGAGPDAARRAARPLGQLSVAFGRRATHASRTRLPLAALARHQSQRRRRRRSDGSFLRRIVRAAAFGLFQSVGARARAS